MLSNYQWDRPINFLSQGGDINIGIKNYLMYEGYSSKLVPFKNKISSTEPGLVDVDELYNKVMNVYTWDDIRRNDYDVDYQNYYTFLGVLPQREIFVSTANSLTASFKVSFVFSVSFVDWLIIAVYGLLQRQANIMPFNLSAFFFYGIFYT